jgi:hypothetical protein
VGKNWDPRAQTDRAKERLDQPLSTAETFGTLDGIKIWAWTGDNYVNGMRRRRGSERVMTRSQSPSTSAKTQETDRLLIARGNEPSHMRLIVDLQRYGPRPLFR